jgi:hypothetical protein
MNDALDALRVPFNREVPAAEAITRDGVRAATHDDSFGDEALGDLRARDAERGEEGEREKRRAQREQRVA